MTTTTTSRLAAGLMASAAALAIAGFTALGAVFDYPKILKSPTSEILADYHTHQNAVTGWFVVLAVSAALLAPIGVLLGRLADGRIGGWIAGVGIAAAVVQVIGLSRWFLFVPGISDDALIPARTADAQDTFELLHRWLGTVVGETIGYALTAAFTTLVVVAITRRVAPSWMTYLGYGSAALIATGVVIPLGVDVASMTNFVGYVAWCIWLIAMAVVLTATRTAVRPLAVS